MPTFHLRLASSSDASAIAQLHVDTFYETHGKYPGAPDFTIRDYQWRKYFAENDGSSFCVVVEDENNVMIGFARGLPYKDQLAYEGELNKIYLLQNYHRMGLGKKLICFVAREFLSRNINSMLLFGEAANPTNRFYEAMGGERLITDKGEFHGGYGWKNLQVLTLHC